MSTETTKTLLDLLRPLAITENQYELYDGSIRYMETELTAPLRAEIARLTAERAAVRRQVFAELLAVVDTAFSTRKGYVPSFVPLVADWLAFMEDVK